MKITKQKLKLMIENIILEGKINYTPKSEWSKNKKDARKDVLEDNITRKRRGTGRRSLLRGSGGGIGFYNEYQD